MSDKKPRKRRGFSQKVTIHDVAREAGVSSITVSRYFKLPEKVASATREAIEAAVKRLDYTPNLAAMTLASNRSPIVAVIVPNLSNSIFSETLQEIERILRPAGLHLLIGHSHYSAQTEEELVRTFLAYRPNALILTGCIQTPATEALVRAAKVPVIQMWSLTETPIDTCVGLSNYQAALQMTRYLIGKGHRRIGYIGGLLENNDRAQQRERGFCAALAEAGLACEPWQRVHAPFEFLAGGEAIHALLDAHELDAVFASSDILAVGVMLACLQRGLKLPADLAIAGFDDAGISSMMTPSLTTLHVPRKAIGAQVAQCILDRLNQRDSGQRIFDLGFELVERDSA
jgi:LacI family gluconate utilization system Gnt-I transcriptional repressor